MTKRSKKAYLILGIGIGITISSTFYSFYPQVEKEYLSDDIIIERATELGMVSLKESINIEKVDNKEVDNKEVDNKGQVPKEELYIELKIEKGDILQDIANKLFALELIDNKDEFILLAEDKMRDKKFVYGTYSIKMNTSYSTMIKILTKDN